MTFFVENLTLRMWTFNMVPHLVRGRTGARPARIPVYAIDASKLGLKWAQMWAKILGISVHRLDFRLVDVRDESGLLIRLRLAFQDLAEVQSDVLQASEFATFAEKDDEALRLPTFLAKNIAAISSDRHTLWRALVLIQIARWTTRERSGDDEDPVLVLEHRPFAAAIRRYTERHHVRVETVRPAVTCAVIASRLLTSRRIVFMRLMRELACPLRFLPRLIFANRSPATIYASTTFPRTRPRTESTEPRLAVEFWGRMNLDRPEYYSDLFFWQTSLLKGEDILITSKLPQDPINERRWEELGKHGIAAIALHSGATRVPDVPVFVHYPAFKRRAAFPEPNGPRTLESEWLSRQIDAYWVERDYWRDLFLAEDVKVYVTWYRFDAFHCPLADALESLGGVSAVYQRSFQRDASPEIAVDADVMFGYAPADADVERRSRSTIPYHVAVGYFGDHRAALLRDRALEVRRSLQNHGAEYILAYFDENSADDHRWDTDHQFIQESYAFLLEKCFLSPGSDFRSNPRSRRPYTGGLGL